MNKPRRCVSLSCESPLFAHVIYCPFCGSRQQKALSPAAPAEEPVAETPIQGVAASVVDISPSSAPVDIEPSMPTPEATPVATATTPRKSKPWWAIGIALLAIAAIAFHFHKTSAGAQCETPSRNILVVLDFSGQASLTTGEIVNRIQKLFAQARNGERFAIFDTRADGPIFETCGSPLSLSTDASIREQMTDTVLQAIATDASPRSASLPNLAQASRQKISLKITDLSLTTYLRANENSLHLVSDLLEGNPGLFDTLCEPAARSAENFRLARRGGMEQAVFVNTHVYLHLVPRQDINARSLNCRDKYWRWLLANTSGSGAGVSIEYLPSSIRSSNE